MGLTFNGIGLGKIIAVKVLSMTPVVDERTGELVLRRVRLEATLAAGNAEAGG